MADTEPDMTIIGFSRKRAIKIAERYIREGRYSRYVAGYDLAGLPYVEMFK